MTEVTIPADVARRIAGVLRHHADTVPPGSPAASQWGALADLLDPPKPSLRDEVAAAMSESWAERNGWEAAAAAVLAVVRRHVEGLFEPHGSNLIDRDDVLRLLGDTNA